MGYGRTSDRAVTSKDDSVERCGTITRQRPRYLFCIGVKSQGVTPGLGPGSRQVRFLSPRRFDNRTRSKLEYAPVMGMGICGFDSRRFDDFRAVVQ